MKYFPASIRTVFEDQSFPDLPVYDRDSPFCFRPAMDGLFQQSFAITSPFTATEPFEMHVARVQS